MHNWWGIHSMKYWILDWKGYVNIVGGDFVVEAFGMMGGNT